MALLRSQLSRVELMLLDCHGYVLAVGGTSGTLYQIPVDGGFVKGPHSAWCLEVKDSSVPTEDRALAVKLLIEADEERFSGEANYQGAFGWSGQATREADARHRGYEYVDPARTMSYFATERVQEPVPFWNAEQVDAISFRSMEEARAFIRARGERGYELSRCFTGTGDEYELDGSYLDSTSAEYLVEAARRERELNGPQSV